MKDCSWAIRQRLGMLVMALLACGGTPVSGDSASNRPVLAVPKTNAGSIVGKTSDGKICRFHASDSKIHCLYDSSSQSEFIAESILTPTFARFGKYDFGYVQVVDGKSYSFLNAEAASPAEGGVGAVYCRLALQFETDAGEIIWIWHEEIRFEKSRHITLIDANGDGLPDLAVSGQWNGNISGTNRWWTPDSYDGEYSAEERQYPARPTFGKLSSSGKNRACKPEEATVASLSDAAASGKLSVGNTVPIWRSIYRP